MNESKNEVAPHGGTWIHTENGFVEISVFETGVPPHFRLYFFTADKLPCPPVTGSAVIIRTVRPDGTDQVFAFIPEPGYLRSTSDIPKPHEFRVALTLEEGDVQRVFETKFTEEGNSRAFGDSERASAYVEG